MQTILITGAGGFIGRNLCVHLRNRPDVQILTAGRETSEADLRDAVSAADTIIHLAGVNRPSDVAEFTRVNCGYTESLAEMVAAAPRPRRFIFASSIQAENDTAYGGSKRGAEEILQNLAKAQPVSVTVFRLCNVFGKWCRPNYNSVVATFCHNIAHDLPIEVHDPDRSIGLVFVDDVVSAISRELTAPPRIGEFRVQGGDMPVATVTLGELAAHLHQFREMRLTLLAPDFSCRFIHQLYSTFLSYIPPESAAYQLQARHDPRGSLAEFIKSPGSGQLFVSRTRPGVTRGNHYHQTKTEKFLVLDGEGLIRLRRIDNNSIVEHRVSGEEYRVVDIPPGVAHSITNVGTKDMVTLFWASEIFDQGMPDTFPLPVTQNVGSGPPGRSEVV